MPPPVHDLAHALRDYGNDVHGLAPRAATVLLVFDDKHRQEIQIPEWLMAAAATAVQSPELNPTDRAILQVFATLGPQDKIRGEEIARRTGYEFNGRFKERLARLVQLGLLSSSRHGYASVPLSPLENGDLRGDRSEGQ